MLTSTDFDNLNEWTKKWFAESDKCINEALCCGKQSKALRAKMAMVYSYWSGLKAVRPRLAETDPDKLEALYARLECLINLKVVNE